MTTPTELRSLNEAVWEGSLPLEIRLAPSDCRVYDQADVYLIHYPRLSYLPFILPKLRDFFIPFLINPEVTPHEGWFSFEDVPLKWHYPVGLLYDLFSGSTPYEKQAPKNEENGGEPNDQALKLPWRLVLHFTDYPGDQLISLDEEGKVLHDAFINSVKEADFLRNGTAKTIMSLSKSDSTQLWDAVRNYSFASFNPIYQRLLNAGGAPLRHIPLRVYLPTSPSASQPNSSHLKVVQSLLTPLQPNSREPQTLGMALHSLLPSLFPHRRVPIYAKPVLHGAIVPMGAILEELLKGAAYLDGWLHIGVMINH
ncbi:MAG: autophagy protein 5 [Icmadophila ericetorum]|nr:autophagy protein 5 [Icmadophila ericetorum]